MATSINKKRAELLSKMLPKTDSGQPRVGEYELGELLGAGGMGIVFKGKRIGQSGDLAIKILPLDVGAGSAEFIKRFDREARLAMAIDHENVVRVVGTGKEGMVLYLAMEFCDGGSLRDTINRSGRLPSREALSIIVQAARGLGAAHEKGIVHRDVKPDNIFHSKAVNLFKIGDLGLAKNTKSNQTTSLTKTNMAFGTPPYMSPEQIANAKTVDARTDIYALGASLYELLTGAAPYVGDTPLAIMRDVLQKPTPDPRLLRADLDQKIAGFIKRTMSKDPYDRPETTQDFISGALEILNSGSRTRTFDFGAASGATTKGIPTKTLVAPPLDEGNAGDSGNVPQTIIDERYTVADISPKGAPLTMGVAMPSPILPKMRPADSLGDGPEPEIIVNSLGMPLLRVDVFDDGGPACAHTFYIGKYPVTWGEFEIYSSTHINKMAKYQNDRHPVSFLTWELAAGFCRYLTERDAASGLLPNGVEYRLPTENEWMRAAGWNYHKKTLYVWPWGNDWRDDCCNNSDSKLDRTRAVGRYIKGISPEWVHDLAGNVYEWCIPNATESRADGYKVLKGGGFKSSRDECMVASRQWADPTLTEPDIGFRVVRTPVASDEKQVILD